MICNELYKNQGLGNQLWNYVVTRIIAKKNGYNFSILKGVHFKGKDFTDLDFGEKISGGITSPGGYLFKLPNSIDNYYRERTELYNTTTLSDMPDDISRTDPQLLTLPDHTKFDGNCQSTKYLQGYRDDILQWISIKDEYKKYQVDKNICLIHLRTGDFINSKAFLPIEYYKNAMSHMRSINPHIVFQCVTDQKEIAEKLLPEVEIIGSSLLKMNDAHHAQHHHGGPVGIDFCLLMSAQYLIIPNSSFSWWAAYLNNNKEVVIAPKYWARFNIADGFWSPADIITDEFTYLDKNGEVFSATECWSEKEVFEKEHATMFNMDNLFNIPWVKPKSLIFAYLRFFFKKIPRIIDIIRGR
jgi:hypothetical protein